MAAEQFCLKWNNFQTSIINAFESLQVTEDLADVTLTCEGMNIKAHKIILSACSPYFRGVFKENPCPHPIVILKDVLYTDLIALLNFMYHGEVFIRQEYLASFLKTAEILKVSGLMGHGDLPGKTTNSGNSVKTVGQSNKVKLTENTDSLVKNKKSSNYKTKLLSTNSSGTENVVYGTEVAPKENTQTIKESNNLTTNQVDVPINDIKMECVEPKDENTNFSDSSCSKMGQSLSILETALDVKECSPSILERSLMATAGKTSLTTLQPLKHGLLPHQHSSENQISRPIQGKPAEERDEDRHTEKYKTSEVHNQEIKSFEIMYGSPYKFFKIDEDSSTVLEVNSDERDGDKRKEKHKLTDSSSQGVKSFDLTCESPCKLFKMDEEGSPFLDKNLENLNTSNDFTAQNTRILIDSQPHHSSQCGNCPHCGKTYSNQSALKYHVRLVHSDLTNMYCCYLCPEAFDYREGYKKHMIDVHSIRN